MKMIKKNQWFILLSISMVLVAGMHQPGWAKETVSNERELDTITVTANKKEANIQDVAGSVSALQGMQIEDAGIDSFDDIHLYVPNFSTFSSGNMGGYDSIRGQTNLINAARAVGVYVDDVPAILSSFTKLTNLYEIERIEVLRGPQGNRAHSHFPGFKTTYPS